MLNNYKGKLVEIGEHEVKKVTANEYMISICMLDGTIREFDPHRWMLKLYPDTEHRN